MEKSIKEKLEKWMLERNKEYNKITKRKHLIRSRRYILKKKGCKGSHTLEEWEAKKKESNYCCVLCGMQEPFIGQYFKRLTEDHIIPISKGGNNYIENIQPLCHQCNALKQNK